MKELAIQLTPGTFSFITFVFIVLKLLGIVHWSWLWVVSPIIVPFALAFIWVVGFGILALITAWLVHRWK